MTTPETVRSPYRLLVLALACQASISIVQWGLGVIAPDLQEQYDLSGASLGALVNATAFGNAVALIVAGVIVDRSGPRKPLLYAGSACGFLLIAGSLLLAAAAGDPNDAIGAADARAVTALSEELASGERRRALADAIRSDLARATGAHLPRAAAVLRELAAPEEDPFLAWRLFCSALLAAAALEE